MLVASRRRLKAGVHRITLVNNEFSIKETFNVTIKADEATQEVRDLTERIQPE